MTMLLEFPNAWPKKYEPLRIYWKSVKDAADKTETDQLLDDDVADVPNRNATTYSPCVAVFSSHKKCNVL